MKAVVLASAMAIAASGCTTMLPKSGDPPVETLVGPAVTRAETPMDAALTCLAETLPRGLDLRIGVADVTDGTGAIADSETLSRFLTQRPDLMLVVALNKAGVRLVNRSSTSVAEWEMKQALEKRLGDGKKTRVGDQTVDFRPVRVGNLLGSTHYVIGALTEVNWNIDSAVAEAGVYGFSAGTRGYYISIGFDLLVTNTKTTEINMARAYNKQVFGRETKAGFYRFFDVGSSGANFGPFELFRANVGQKKNEPVQAAVRWVMETAAYDMVRELSGVGDACDEHLPGASQLNNQQMVSAEPQPAATAAPPEESGESIEPPAGTRSPEIPPLRVPQETPYVVPVWPSSADEDAAPADAEKDGSSTRQASNPVEDDRSEEINLSALPPTTPAGEKTTSETADAATSETAAGAESLESLQASEDEEDKDEAEPSIQTRLTGIGSGFGFQALPQ